MTTNRNFIRTVLLLQTGMLAVLVTEATVVAVVGIGSSIPMLLTAAAMVFIGDSARTGKLGRRLAWTERLLIATFGLDLAIALITALAVPEPTVWVSRLAVPVFVLRSIRSNRPDHPVEVERTELATA